MKITISKRQWEAMGKKAVSKDVVNDSYGTTEGQFAEHSQDNKAPEQRDNTPMDGFMRLRTLIEKVEQGIASQEEDTDVYRILGDTSKEYLQGVIRGMNLGISHLKH